MKNFLKYNKAFVVITCLVLAVLIAANVVITQIPLVTNTMNTVFGEAQRKLVSGDPSTLQYYTPDEGADTKAGALALANAVNEQICEEGFILLRNTDNALPLTTSEKISVFGINSVDLVYGGSGSAGKSDANSVDLYKSLADAGFDVNPTLKSFYEGKKSSGAGRPASPAMGTVLEGFATGELAQSEYDGSISAYTSGYTDAALVVFSRIGGEGFDLPRTMKDTAGVSDPTQHYLELDDNEKALLEAVTGAGFGKVIVIINCSATMELGFLEEYDGKIDAALWIGTPGSSGMTALGRILSGAVNPSGRTVDTFARDLTSAPTWYNHGNNLGEGNTYTVNGAAQNAHFVDYEEGIYVGYRYYETRGYTESQNGNQDWYAQNVVFPFGYGLSYTEFTWKLGDVTLGGEPFRSGQTLSAADQDKTFAIDVEVTNTGTVPGKDVVQLYCSAPYVNGEVEKSHVVLSDIAKTGLLQPGESETVHLELAVRDTASYDYADLNQNGSRTYEADEGEYNLYIGKNAHDAWAESTLSVQYTLSEDLIFGTDSVTGHEVSNRFDSVSNHITQYLSRADWEGTWPTTPTDEDKELGADSTLIQDMTVDGYIGSGTDVDIGKPWYVANVGHQRRSELSYNDTSLKLWSLVGASYDDPRWEDLLDELTFAQMCTLIGTGNFNTAALENIDKPKTTDPDGPAGFTNFMALVESTAVVYDTCFYCSECVVSATWSEEMAYAMGNAAGNESLAGNERGDGRTYSGWYAPACNIHRSPFSGRNWEYYSEDGTLSGMIAANVVAGAKEKGVYTYIKHFAFNDQETDRDNNGILTWLNEQAMREIYLKPFEYTVKVGKTTAMMSSFNRVGPVWAGGCYELLTEILRDEWGFQGMVITDYAVPEYLNADQMIRAGGDLMLFQDRQPSSSGVINYRTHQASLRRATKDILYTVVNSNAMNGMGEGVVYKYAMPVWMIALIVLDAVIVGLLVLWGVLAARKTARRAANGTLPAGKKKKK